ncbi:MAG TPA: hypothetical protein PKU77_11985 [Ferruginibacter sp.]|nr:hypothetical protein [Ferruginibacter sp.]
MTDLNQSNDTFSQDEFNAPKLPSGLNVLTILTFIGCAIQLLGGVFQFMGAQKNYDEREKMLQQVNSDQLPGWAKAMMPDPAVYEEMVTKSMENKIPIFILTLVATALCFYGALQMRKLKKQGYPMYVIGQVLPFLTSILFLGAFAFKGIGFAIGTGIVLLFILLYTMQRKHLRY